MLRWRGRRATTDLDKRNPGMVIFLRRLTIRGQPKKWGDKSERLLTKRATHPIDPKRSISFLHSRRSAKPNFCQWKSTKRSLAALTYRPKASIATRGNRKEPMAGN